MWQKTHNYTDKYFFTVKSNKFEIRITGGSVIISDTAGNEIIRFTGFNYLYTGDINPSETELFALENGKHFYIFSLKSFSQLTRITLPQGYEAIDVFGFYSDDGRYISIPVERYIETNKNNGYYEYSLCKYNATTYKLIDHSIIDDITPYQWE